MKKAELQNKLAYLESINDILSTELGHINDLMRIVGFSNGIETLKWTAEELIAKGYMEVPEYYN
jgi:hypothetical protein